MEIKVDFSELWGEVRRLSAAPVEFDWVAAAQLDPIDIELLEGREVRLEDLDVINGLLSVDGRQVLLYIPDQFSPVDVVQASPEKGKRFHVADCKTLADMRAKGRFERYLVTNNLTGVFSISGKNSRGMPEELDSRLLVCKNCLEKLNYQNYCHDSARSHIWQRFEIARFFETYSTSFTYLPRNLGQRAIGNDYTADWAEVSADVRRRCGFKCDCCGLDLSEHRHLLHVHHVNGVKQDNSSANLRPLCADCHRKQPLHEHMFISMTDMQLLTRLRREQNITADDWAQVLELADLSVHGALMHARQRGFPVPEIGYEFVNTKGVVVASTEVAWLERRVALCLSEAPDIDSWTVLSSAAFIDNY
ncbi:hypothetical protein [Pseudomonas aeruginosa]|uniref:hypothetical protein n=1 Tax=Pseudomonas aeruginosa group TaxID=136841 RepID=UPI000E30ECAE|nr:hypothetical protein [Pseudomonas aeruginosa]EIU3709792.1 hypothetical protein [Pseudomonas aeruginosa]EIU3903975.1 hypothetical protein [Pseudomonas aeruginosa]EKV3211796.1 hypothetical protein [Pseudomonas aeruginosa]MDE8656663.1 hypothetical protein [Pseudomonas aeruginosa]MDE8664410.1 hypothetical protein [Pseudomonas aeruginosa]